MKTCFLQTEGCTRVQWIISSVILKDQQEKSDKYGIDSIRRRNVIRLCASSSAGAPTTPLWNTVPLHLICVGYLNMLVDFNINRSIVNSRHRHRSKFANILYTTALSLKLLTTIKTVTSCSWYYISPIPLWSSSSVFLAVGSFSSCSWLLYSRSKHLYVCTITGVIKEQRPKYGRTL